MDIHHILETIIPIIAGILELIGVIIITFGALKGIVKLIMNKFNLNDDSIGIELAKAMALSLEFKLGAEIIKTVIVQDMKEFYMIAAVAALRIIITFVLHWEIQHSEHEN